MKNRTLERKLPSVYDDLIKYEPLNGIWYFDDLIGQGSTSAVFALKDKSCNPPRFSAGKVIRTKRTKHEFSEEPDNAELIAAIQEITIASELRDCENIVKYINHFVFEREDRSGQDIIIQSELLTSLSSYFLENVLTESDVLKIGIDVCSALVKMEEKGILHRDIKPSNIFVDENGTYKLGDFGAAAYNNIENCDAGVVGTHYYIAPEIYRKNHYDHRADIYSLGMMMYRYLNNGQISFDSSETSQCSEALFSVQMNGGKIEKPVHASTELGKIVMKCCDFDPEKRYRSAKELQAALLKVKQANGETDIRPAESVIEVDATQLITVDMTYRHSWCSHRSDPRETTATENKKKWPKLKAWFKKVAPNMVNWLFFTCLFSLMPLLIFVLCREVFAPNYPWKIKWVVELLYFGLSLAVISIRELVNQEMWNKGRSAYLLTLFAMLCILILAAVFFGIMTINDMKLLPMSVNENLLLIAAIVISTLSFLIGTGIQLWKEG